MYFRLLAQWEQRWQRLGEGIPTCVLQLGKSATVLLANGAEIAKEYHKGSLIGAVVAGTRLIANLAALRGNTVFRPVHLSVNNYLRTHPQRMVAAVSRVFDEDPRSVRRKMEAVGSSTTTVWRQALAKLQALCVIAADRDGTNLERTIVSRGRPICADCRAERNPLRATKVSAPSHAAAPSTVCWLLRAPFLPRTPAQQEGAIHVLHRTCN